MSVRIVLPGGIVGLMLVLGYLAGCDGSQGTAPPTGGAGIPGVRGPVSSQMPKAGAGKGARAQGLGPAARRAAPAPAPGTSDSGATPPAQKD